MQGSAIGLQVLHQQGDRRVGERGAEALLVCCDRLENLWPVDRDLREESAVVRFSLVCDPMYRDVNRDVFRPLPIAGPEDVLTGPAGTYDMGFSTDVSTALHKRLRSAISGVQLRLLAHNPNHPAIAQAETIPFVLGRYEVNSKGEKTKHRSDIKWDMVLETDLGGRLPVVRIIGKLPVWCTECRAELVGHVRLCQTCDRFNACWSCAMQASLLNSDHSHPIDHQDRDSTMTSPALNPLSLRDQLLFD